LKGVVILQRFAGCRNAPVAEKKRAKLTAWLPAGKALSECQISNKEHRSSKFAIQYSIFVRGLGGPAAWHGVCNTLN
jgi:hypothetical protein